MDIENALTITTYNIDILDPFGQPICGMYFSSDVLGLDPFNGLMNGHESIVKWTAPIANPNHSAMPFQIRISKK